MKLRVTLLVALTAIWAVSYGQESTIESDEINRLVANKVRTVQHIALNPTILRATLERNSSYGNQDVTSPAFIKSLVDKDKEWTSNRNFRRALQQNSAGRLLKRLVSSNPALTEAFLTDKVGANVAAFPPTTDYYQGDEAKWQNAFNNGEGKVFRGPLGDDASTKTRSVQISAPVFDGDVTVGVLIVGISLNYLDSKRK